jgi:outer membrane receptor protein involved in Fe transport
LFILASGLLAAMIPSAATGAERCRPITLAAGSLSGALRDFARQTSIQIIFDEAKVSGRRIRQTRISGCPAAGLRQLARDHGLVIKLLGGNIYLVTVAKSALARQASTVRRPPPPSPPDEIVVTARRRAETADAVPIALARYGGEKLEEDGVDNVAQVLAQSPGVGAYDQGDGLSSIAIRGISTSLGANENGYYLDDLPFTGVTVPISPDVRVWDLDRIEVLRGPQGTLFGEGSLGGTVRVLTKNAELDRSEAKANAFLSASQDGGTNGGIKGAVNVPIIAGTLALRLAGTHERFDGWIDDAAAGTTNLNRQQYDTFRAKIRFDPSERLSINAGYWLLDSDFPGGSSAATDAGVRPRSFRIANKMEYRLLGASARYTLPGSELFYGFSHNRFRLPQGGDVSGGSYRGRIGIRVNSHELRIASTNDGALQWLTGLYLRDAAREDRIVFPRLTVDNMDFTSSRTRAAFGEATYSLGTFDLTAGLRLFREELSGYESNFGVITTDTAASYTSLNPRIGIAWHARPGLMVYAGAARGFRGGQLQPTYSKALAAAFDITLPDSLYQDSIWTYEGGAKAKLWGERIDIDLAAFVSRWNNTAVRIPIGDSGFNGLINSDGAISRGVELNVIMHLLAGLTMSASGAFIDSDYSGTIEGTGITKGTPVENVAKAAFFLSAEYRAQLLGHLTGSVRTSWQHSSPRRSPAFPENLPGDRMDRIDLRLALEFGRDSIALFADNLTNERGAVSNRTVLSGTDGLDSFAFRERPRTIGIEVLTRFR